MRDRNRGWTAVIRTLVTTVMGHHGWVALGGILAVVGILCLTIYCLVLVTRLDQGAIKIKTPFFTITREPSSIIEKTSESGCSRAVDRES